jgi:hypothetical protein
MAVPYRQVRRFFRLGESRHHGEGHLAKREKLTRLLQVLPQVVDDDRDPPDPFPLLFRGLLFRLFRGRLAFRRSAETLERVPEKKGDDRESEDDPADDEAGVAVPAPAGPRADGFCWPYGAIYTRAERKKPVFFFFRELLID